ncbi:MAG: amidohydrolase [Planctomycetes bacterium]|nr:amidohydrolase [Planctomycetota bacterium]
MHRTGHSGSDQPPELLLHGGRITTLDAQDREVTAVAIRGGRFVAAGSDAEILPLAERATRRIDLRGQRVIPGLNDSHLHVIRGGLHYNLELRWEGIPSLAEALARLRTQAANTPPPQWVRVVGGWSEFQFRERRLPTLAELNEAAPDTPVFVLHLYAGALLNRAALRALGYERDLPVYPGSFVERDGAGRPTGLLLAKPSAMILYKTLALAPRLEAEDRAISTRHFVRELNRLGVTSAIDAGGGGQSYPDDYEVVTALARAGELDLRIGFHLFAQNGGSELADYTRWIASTRAGSGDSLLRLVGAGENLTWSAADFENFLEPRPELAPTMEGQLEPIVRALAAARWPFRIHATYEESIARFLDVFERVDRVHPLRELRWFLDHAETISERSLARVKALGGGIAIQHRMAFQGEAFVARYGAAAARRSPPVRRMLELGLPVGAGTDATRVASYDPWVCLHWLTTGKTLGGLALYGEENLLDRKEALRLWTRGSAWFSGEEQAKGAIAVGQHADLAVLSRDYFAVPDAEIRAIHSELTLVGGRIAHTSGAFQSVAPPPLPVSPSWSPSARFDAAAARTLLAAAELPGSDSGCDCTPM